MSTLKTLTAAAALFFALLNGAAAQQESGEKKPYLALTMPLSGFEERVQPFIKNGYRIHTVQWMQGTEKCLFTAEGPDTNRCVMVILEHKNGSDGPY